MSTPERLGKYAIEAVLGKGAMGVVYKGFDPQIERTVAIKTVRKDLMDGELALQFMSRFKNEARAAGRLHHPNIVGIYEYGEDETVAFIAMEYVDGTGLGEYLNRATRFGLPELAGIFGQLLRALEFAHDRGVVHRDIKPANLILTQRGELKVADFGIARIDTSELTLAGTVLGTPSYMSPEQCQGKETDSRSDLFSAGVVFYELLTGKKPFTGTAETIMYQICREEPPPPSTRSALALSPAIDALVAKALAKAAQDRFQSARAFQQALQAATAAGATAGDAASDLTVVDSAYTPLPPMAPAAWDDGVLSTVEKQLARFLGPMAKVHVRKAAAQTHSVEELYSILATNIGDPQERRKFVAASHGTDAGTAAAAHAGGSGSTHGGATGGKTAVAASDRSRAASTGTRVPAQPLEQAFVDATTARLAVYLGPIARVVAKKAAAQATSQDDFVRAVAGFIGTQDRAAFLREMGFDAE